MSSDSNVLLPQEINTRYKIHNVIGSGAYGTVYEAMDNVAREINVLSPPDLTNYSSDNGGKDMLMKEKERDVSHLEWNLKDIKWILYQLLCGLEYLHSYKIIHRDIKPSNILITDQNEVRICDFGLSREMKEIENETYLESDINSDNENLSSSMTKHVVTRFYRAPELCLCENYNEKIDVWAVGCIMSELFDYLNVKCERVLPLFPGSNSILSIKDLVSSEDIKKERYDENSQIYRIIQILGNPPKDDLDWIRNIKTRKYIQEMSNNVKINNNKINFDKKFEHIRDKNGIELIKSMLIYNPHKRISIRESLKNPFFDEVRDESLEELINSHILYNNSINDNNNNNNNEWIDDSLYEIENIKSMVSDEEDMELLKKYINKEFKYHEYMYSPPVKNNSKSSTHSNSCSLKSSSLSVEFMDSLKSFGGSLTTNSYTNNNNSLIRSDCDSEYIKKTFYRKRDKDDDYYDEYNDDDDERIKSDIFNEDDDDNGNDSSCSSSDNKMMKKDGNNKSNNSVKDKKKKKKVIKKRSSYKSDENELSRERTRDNRRNRKENYNPSITRTTTTTTFTSSRTLTKTTTNRNNSNTKRIIKKKSTINNNNNTLKTTTTTTAEKRKSKEMRKVSEIEIQEYINKIKEKENVIKSASNSRSSTDTSVTSEKEKGKEIMEEEDDEVNDGEDIFFSNINELF